MNTASPANTPDTQPWTTKSKKLMSFGGIIILATIGFEPIFQQMSTFGLVLSAIAIFIDLWVAYEGYWDK